MKRISRSKLVTEWKIYGFDSYDKWGSTMQMLFVLAGAMAHRFDNVPHELNYSNPIRWGAKPDKDEDCEYYEFELWRYKYETLKDFSLLLNRYAQFLKYKNLDY